MFRISNLTGAGTSEVPDGSLSPDEDSFPRALLATDGGLLVSAPVQSPPVSGLLSNGQVVPSGSDPEVTFISGVTSAATVASTSFGAWDGNNPATYSPPYSFSAK